MSTITMNLYYTGVKGNAQKFAQEMESSGTAAAIRAEEGNLKYNYFISMDDPETVLLIDSWKDQASLDDADDYAASRKVRSPHACGALFAGG